MSDIEWVAESDWSKVTVGQKVRLVNVDGSVEFEARYNAASSGVWSHTGYYARSESWSLFVEAPPAVVLPTERGLYSDRDGDAWLLDVYGDWVQLTEVGVTGGLIAGRDAADYVPFTRLAPVPETAKKVLDAILKTVYVCNNNMQDGGETRDHIRASAERIADKFGVTL